MTNHPNRAKAKRGIPPASPTPEQIRDLRIGANLTQTEAAAVVYAPLRTWQGWEAPEGVPAHRTMPAAAWELFAVKLHARGIDLPDHLKRHVESVLRPEG